MNINIIMPSLLNRLISVIVAFSVALVGLLSYHYERLFFLVDQFRDLIIFGSFILIFVATINIIDIIYSFIRPDNQPDQPYKCINNYLHINCYHDELYRNMQQHDQVASYWLKVKIVIILFPVGIFVLGLPSNTFTIQRQLLMLGNQYELNISLDLSELVKDVLILEEYTNDRGEHIRIVKTNSGVKLRQIVDLSGQIKHDIVADNAISMRFSDINDAAYDQYKRQMLAGTTVHVEGRLKKISDKEFTLFRLKMTCCAADTVALKMRIRSPQALIGYSDFEWVRVKGQLTFIYDDRSNVYMPVLFLSDITDITRAKADSEYEQ